MATIQKRGDTYRIRVSEGYDSQGKQIMRSMTWKPEPGMTVKQAEKELQRQALLFEETVKAGRYVDPSIKFQAFAEQWFEDYGKEHLRDRTYYRYRQLSERTYAAIGHLPLGKIKPRHLIQFYQQLAEPGQNKRTGGALAPKTIKHYHTFISSVLERAYKWGVILENPAHRTDSPKAPKKDLEFLDEVEIVQLLEALEREPVEHQAMFQLLIYSGMRRSELLGLEWQDIDFSTGVVSIVRTSQYCSEMGIYTDTTKTQESQRSFKIPRNVIEVLERHRWAQRQQRRKLGDQWQDSDRLFTKWDGSPMSLNTPYLKFEKILSKNGIRKVSLHSLRHSNATLLINQGINIKAVSSRLGHSQTSTTMNTYAHQIKSADAAAADALELTLGRERKGA